MWIYFRLSLPTLDFDLDLVLQFYQLHMPWKRPFQFVTQDTLQLFIIPFLAKTQGLWIKQQEETNSETVTNSTH